MESEEGGRLQYDRSAEQSAGTNEESGQTGDNAVYWAEVRCAFPTPIQDNELVLDKKRLGNDGASATRTHQLGDSGN